MSIEEVISEFAEVHLLRYTSSLDLARVAMGHIQFLFRNVTYKCFTSAEEQLRKANVYILQK